MYYWLKENLEEEYFYVISDESDDVYVVGGCRPYKLKPTKHMSLINILPQGFYFICNVRRYLDTRRL